MPEGALTIAEADWESIVRHAQRLDPLEACGLLGGRDGVVEAVIPVDNVARSAHRFRMHPAQQVRAIFELEERGLELLAIYHSHPSGVATPSQIDFAEWLYGQTLSLIVSKKETKWVGTAFQTIGSGFQAVGLHIIPSGPVN